VLEISPAHVGAHEYLGLAEYRLGRYEAAYEHLARAWIYNPQNGTTIYYLARLQARRGLAQLAIENFNQAEKLGFDPNAVAVSRGLAWMQSGGFQNARDDFQKALAVSPARKDASLYLAKALYLLEDYPSARAQLSALQPDIPPSLQPDYLALSGWVFLRQDSPANALAVFNQWLNLDPDNGQALNAMGWAALYGGECQTAKFYFDGASQALQGEWTVSPDSLAGADETPQAGLAVACQ
jgi:tetratricopeptide (TPR) repeat protein